MKTATKNYQTTILDKDIKVFYVTAKSYPDGILESHQRLHSLIPFSTNRKYFGTSRPENGTIVYRAAAEEINPGEAKKLKCGTLILKKGKYISTVIKDYMKHVEDIAKTFEALLSHSDIDPEGYCVEWYMNEDITCMVRLKD